MSYKAGDIIFNKYRLEGVLGKGAFGEVWLATHTSLHVLRAVKLLRKDAPGLGSTGYAEYRKRFEIEAQLGAQIKHHRLVPVYDFEHSAEELALVMEYYPGGSLADRLAQSSAPLDIDDALRMVYEVSEGLAVLHGHKLVHRDLHPANILFDEQNGAHLADLGSVQMSEGSSYRTDKGSLAEPHPGHPSYRSPEHENPAKSLPPASDVYMLGAVLFEALSKQPYYLQRPGTDLHQMRPDSPGWVNDLLIHMLAPNPNQRIWDGPGVVNWLQTHQAPKLSTGVPVWAHQRKIWQILAIMAILVGVVGLLAKDLRGMITDARDPSMPIATTMSPPPPDDHAPTPTDMVLIPSGSFTMGGNVDTVMEECKILYEPFISNMRCDRDAFSDVAPAHKVNLDDFWIDMFEVTNARYALCVEAGACAPPSDIGLGTTPNYYSNPAYANYPVLNVDWNMALAYCQWSGGRLPTEAEWEKAARGALVNANYPWGDEFDGTRVNFCDNTCAIVDDRNPSIDDGFPYTAPAGSYTPNNYGLYDMAGNVWEWTNSLYQVYPYNPTDGRENVTNGGHRVLRGGAWNYYGFGSLVAVRAEMDPSTTADNIGFRCARDP